MSEHISAQDIERYRRRTLPPAELLTVDDHLALCEACRRRLGEAEQLPAAFASLRADLQAAAGAEPDHLLYEQLAAYVDDELDEADRETVESHLEICPQCVAEVRDLRAFRAMMTTYPAKEYAPVAPPTLGERLLAFWRSPARWIPLQVAGTAAVAALFVWAAARPLQTQVATLRTQRSQLQRRGAALQQRALLAEAQRARLQQENAGLAQERERLQQEGEKILQERERIQQESEKALQERERLQKEYSRLAQLQQPPPSQTPSLSRIAGDLEKLIGKAGTLMGASEDGFALLSPVGTFVQTERPAFRWQPLAGATSYAVTISSDPNAPEVATAVLEPAEGGNWRVTVYDASGKVVTTGESPSGTEWTLPRALSLKRGDVYSWQVVATLKGGSEVKAPPPQKPDAKFKVLEQAKIEELERAKRRHADSHLALAILYAQYGLVDDAERELRALRRADLKSP